MKALELQTVRVLHVISSLGGGGAEGFLVRLIQAKNAGTVHMVVTLTGGGKHSDTLRREGVNVVELGMPRGRVTFGGMLRLSRTIRAEKPNIVQTWMYHADLLGGIVARLVGCKNVVWSIRNTAIPQGRYSVTGWVIRCCALLSSRLPKAVVCCAESARRFHAGIGYRAKKMLVISNGYSFEHLINSSQLRASSRHALGYTDDNVVVGIVGRYDKLKDHGNFIAAAMIVASQRPLVRFLMVGRDVDSENRQLMDLIAATSHADKFHLLGERMDVTHCYAAMDTLCLASKAEGFPNVVVEAMAMEIPCVVTDVGDAALIVQDSGYVVPQQNAEALAGALIAMVDLQPHDRFGLGRIARMAVLQNYPIERIADCYDSLYRSLITK